MVLFGKYYKKLAIYSNIEKPLFLLGFSAMLLQGIVFAYVYPLIANVWLFGFGLFMVLVSFMVFAEAAKQKSTSLGGFLCIQVIFSLVQAILVT